MFTNEQIQMIEDSITDYIWLVQNCDGSYESQLRVLNARQKKERYATGNFR